MALPAWRADNKRNETGAAGFGFYRDRERGNYPDHAVEGFIPPFCVCSNANVSKFLNIEPKKK